MHLKQINESFDHTIVEGSEYQWNCFGKNARFLDYENDYARATVVFDTKNQYIYEASVNSKESDETIYRYLSPDFKEKYLRECEVKDVDPAIAFDDVRFIDLEVEEDFLEKGKALFANKPFDKRIQIPLELSDEEFNSLAMMAHENDITINKMIEKILLKMIKEQS